MIWQPEPREKCYVEAVKCERGRVELRPAQEKSGSYLFIPHDIVDVLEVVTLTQCDTTGDNIRPRIYRDGGAIAAKTRAALECLVQCGRLERVDGTTARYRRKTR